MAIIHGVNSAYFRAAIVYRAKIIDFVKILANTVTPINGFIHLVKMKIAAASAASSAIEAKIVGVHLSQPNGLHYWREHPSARAGLARRPNDAILACSTPKHNQKGTPLNQNMMPVVRMPINEVMP